MDISTYIMYVQTLYHTYVVFPKNMYNIRYMPIYLYISMGSLKLLNAWSLGLWIIDSSLFRPPPAPWWRSSCWGPLGPPLPRCSQRWNPWMLYGCWKHFITWILLDSSIGFWSNPQYIKGSRIPELTINQQRFFWVNDDNSLTWIKANWEWLPCKPIISMVQKNSEVVI